MKRIPFWILFWPVVALFYGVLLKRSYLGFFNDDALYVIMAKSLLQGRYSNLCLPHEPPMNHFLPGYPLFLSMFVGLIEPHWMGLRVVSLFVTMASSVLLARFARLFFEPSVTACVVAAYAFNPITADFSSAVMPETLFIVLMLGSFLLMAGLLKRETIQVRLALAGLLVWVSLLRQESILLPACMAVAFLMSGRRRLAWQTALPALLVWGGVHARNHFLTGTTTDYFGYWTSSHFGMQKLRATLGMLFVKSVAGAGLSLGSVKGRFAAAVLIPLGMAMSVIGFAGLRRRSRGLKPVMNAVILFASIFAALHAAWYVLDVRYFLPILPLIWMALMESGRVLWTQYGGPFSRAALVSFAAAVALFYIDQDSYMVSKAMTRSDPPPFCLPQTSLDWINQSVSKNACLLSNKMETLYLYTGRQGHIGLSENEPREWPRELQEWGITQIVFCSQHDLDPTLSQHWGQLMEWISRHPEVFPVRYLNREEQLVVFDVHLEHLSPGAAQ